MEKENDYEKIKTKILKGLGYIEYLVNTKVISMSKFRKSRQRLITELHTLNYIYGKHGTLDSEIWLKEMEQKERKQYRENI